MNTELKEYIIDAYDDAMASYLSSEEYRGEAGRIDDQIADFRSTLSPTQAKTFTRILNDLSNQYAGVAGEAYYRGVAHGVNLRYDVE